jgi:hypothetical protein
MILASSIQNKLYPTTTEAMAALRLADGSTVETTNTTTMQQYLDRMSVASPRLSGHILTRKTALSSYSFDIEGQPEAKAKATKMRLNKVINAVVAESVNASLFGCFCVRLKWAEQGGEIVPTIDKVYKPYEIEKGPDTLYLLEVNGSQITKTDIKSLSDSQKYIWGTDSASWHGGSMRSVIFHEILRNDTLKEWANYNKKLKGIIQGRADEAEKADAANALKTIAENNYAVTSKDVEFKMNETTSSKGVDSFEKFKQELEADIAIAILGQANTAQLPNSGGSRAALQILNLIRSDIHFSDMLQAKRVINDQLLAYDYQLNSDNAAQSSPFSFEFVYDADSEVETYSRVIESAVRIGIPMKADEVYNKLGLTQPQPADEIFKPISQNTGL